jgi:squalene-hopene/tetraprenyl-beta-curcumene cyclase
MALKAILSIPHKYSAQDGPFITKPGDWLMTQQKESGAIVGKDEKNANYETSTAIMALAKLKEFDAKRYGPPIDKAIGYIKGCQYATAEGDPKSGGVGYLAGDTKVDLPNSHQFLSALKFAGYNKDSKEFKNALAFLERCQASAEVNKQEWAKTAKDGGGRYNEKGVTQDKAGASTGALSYALLSSYLYMELPQNDPRRVAVLNYVTTHYSVEDHPGLGADGLYYYYVMMAKALEMNTTAGGSYIIKTPDGAEHDWTVELGQKMISLQQKDGSFMNSKSSAYWEGDPVLCTAYSMLAMGKCYQAIEAELKTMNIELEEDD